MSGVRLCEGQHTAESVFDTVLQARVVHERRCLDDPVHFVGSPRLMRKRSQ